MSAEKELSKLPQEPEAILEWVGKLRERFQSRPVAVAVEQSKGCLVYALMAHEFIMLYPINPATLAQYRKAFVSSRAKDDPLDAGLLTDLVQLHREHLRAWKADTPETRRLQLLVEHRRQAVDERTRLTCILTAALSRAHHGRCPNTLNRGVNRPRQHRLRYPLSPTDCAQEP